MSVNNYRKCSKCGRTRVEDMSVTYHRFPYPGPSNITKARAWAIYCWPNKDISMQFLQALYTSHKVLCGRHFNSIQFYDSNRQKLSKFAVPDSTAVKELLDARKNNFKEDVKGTDATECILREPLAQIENIKTESILAEPCSSATVQQEQAESNIQSELITGSTSESISPTTQQCKTPLTKSCAILRELNISNLSEMTPREIKLYNICQKNCREIIRLRNKLKNIKKDYIAKVNDNKNVQKNCDLSNDFYLIVVNKNDADLP